MIALSLSYLVKQFGALRATDGVSLDIPARECHALIGPNGAGKSTLIGLMTGELQPDQGHILLAGQDVTAWSVDKRARAGLARSFQITQLIYDMSVLDNVVLAVQARVGHSFHFIRSVQSDDRLREPALDVLEQIGLIARAHDMAGDLSHGERRQLELAIALAMKPQILLLDEPMAGMGPHETARMVEILRSLRGHITMVLVEHDMDVVFALADRISVLVAGQNMITGTSAEVRADERVRKAYLGESQDVAS